MFKSKIKKFLDFFHKGQPSSECNDPEVKALLEAGERIKRSAFHSSPASSNFQAKLLAEIKEKRRLNQNSMQDKIGIWMREFFHPTRLKAAVAFVVLVAVVATTFHFWPGQEGQWSRLLIDTAYAHDNFEVEPTKSDSIGIEGDTAFVIKSKVAIDRGTLEKNIKLFPEVKFELQQVNDKEFKLVPKEELKPKTVYRVYITSSYVNENGITTDRNYSWAFQVKNIFKIMHTLPRDRASGVPINSGIEVTFSHENVKDFEKNFSITPKAIGRFEYHKRTAVFVPKGLTPGIIYTVTIKKGVGIKDSKETLERGTTFQFETMPSEKQENSAYRSFYFSNNFVEFDTAHEPALPAYFHSSDRNAASSSVHITVYAYPSAEEFAKSIEEYYRVPNWADYNRKEQREDPKRLVKIQSFTTQEYTHGYQSFILFPEKLTAGFYLVEGVLAGTNEQPRQMFLQITDLASYLNVNTNKTLLWINDMTTGKPVSGAHVVSTDKKISVSTDGSGVATFETGQLGKPVKDYYSLERYLTVQSGSKSAVVPVTVYDDTYYGADSFDDYWSYLYTDRQLYQGNDTVNVWGFLERRDKKAIEEPLTVEIVSGGYDYFGDSISIAAASVQLEKNGSWTTKLPLQNVKPGVYYMNLKVGDTFLTARTIMVEKYVKPAYSLEVTPDKRAVFLGEKMAFSVSAKFFEGTPLTNLKLAYKIENQRGEVTTDATGKARLEFDSATFSRYATLDVWPYDAEEAEIAGSASVEIFPAK
ncbi:MAG TPA: Ig-like domain-containing protein, partial [Patescibacteria group bacterium]|nr:Ig-like domain-containing protein [Patescibacteria group bacterium]